jgi:hypothetical protein
MAVKKDGEAGFAYVLTRTVVAASVGIAVILWGLASLISGDAHFAMLLLPFAAGAMACFAVESISDAIRARSLDRRAAAPVVVRRDPDLNSVAA